MKSPTWILQGLLLDAAIWCDASTTRDLETITSRIEHEGESFLSISLPTFGACFEQALDRGYCLPTDFPGFRRRRGRPLPLFLGGLVSLVFDPGTGSLLNEPNIDAIFYVRQICYTFKKVLRPCSERRQRKAYKKYVQTDLDIESAIHSVNPELMRRFDVVAGVLYSTRLSSLNSTIMENKHVPKHGPGATSERLSSNSRYDIRSWFERLNTHFPMDLFAWPNPGHGYTTGESTDANATCTDPGRNSLGNGQSTSTPASATDSGLGRDGQRARPAPFGTGGALQSFRLIEEDAEDPVRVVSVPKTAKTPRIIAIEPSCMQYAQQSLLEKIVPALEASCFRGALGFSDQEPNRYRALLGSKDGTFATLDLSDASDRVHLTLVSNMLRSIPVLRDAVIACRSQRADVPGEGVIPLSKFASMGSALCFPMEAMVFLTIVLVSILEPDFNAARVPSGISRKIDRALATVRVYGDDIIVPTDIAYRVKETLEAFCLKVNTAKSFWTGKFRESCGSDCYDGVNITPVYLRKELPESLDDALSVVGLMETRNALYKKGCWETVKKLDAFLSGIAKFPIVLETSPMIGFISNLGYQVRRWNKDLHRFEMHGPCLKLTKRRDPLDGYGALMKFFLKRGSLPIQDVEHLKYAGRPVAANIVRRWALPY